MGKIKKIDLYSTHLNDTYNNVYAKEYYEVFNSLGENNIPHKEIIFTSEKGFNLNKIDNLILINDFDYEKFNYVIITTNDNIRYYYFITSYTLISANNTISYSLKYDVWANVVAKNSMFELGKQGKVLIERRTYDGFIDTGEVDGDYLPIFKYDNFAKEEQEKPLLKNNYVDCYYTNKYSGISSDTRILFLKYVVNKDSMTNIQLGANISNTTPESTAVYTLYIPYAFIGSDSKVKDSDYHFINTLNSKVADVLLQVYQRYDNNDIDLLNTLIKTLDTNCIEKSFTYNPKNIAFVPLVPNGPRWIYRGLYAVADTSLGSFADYTRFKCGSNENSPYIYILGGLGDILTDDVEKFLSKSITKSEFSEEISPSSYYIDRVMSYNTINPVERRFLEPRINMYPYYYLSIKLNDTEIPIMPVQNCHHYYIEQYGGLNSKTITTFGYTELLEKGIKPIKHFSQSTGSLPIEKDAYTEFIRANQAQLATNKLIDKINVGQSFINAVPSIPIALAGMQSVGSSISGLLQPINAIFNQQKNSLLYKAKLEDASGAIDNVSSPSFDAFNDQYIQDGYIIVSSSLLYEDDEEYLFEFFTKYGINYEEFGDLTSRQRYYFDFIKTVDCEISLNTDSENNDIIRRIFNRGVRIWYGETSEDEFYANDQKSIISNFNTSIYNHPLTIYNRLFGGN